MGNYGDWGLNHVNQISFRESGRLRCDIVADRLPNQKIWSQFWACCDLEFAADVDQIGLLDIPFVHQLHRLAQQIKSAIYESDFGLLVDKIEGAKAVVKEEDIGARKVDMEIQNWIAVALITKCNEYEIGFVEWGVPKTDDVYSAGVVDQLGELQLQFHFVATFDCNRFVDGKRIINWIDYKDRTKLVI